MSSISMSTCCLLLPWVKDYRRSNRRVGGPSSNGVACQTIVMYIAWMGVIEGRGVVPDGLASQVVPVNIPTIIAVENSSSSLFSTFPS